MQRLVGPGKIVAGVAALVMSAGLVFGLASVAGAASTSSGTASSAAARSDAAVSANCAQVRKRLAGAPATLRRVDANLTELRARVAEVRLPVRRRILEQRIERLAQLHAAIEAKVTEARAACGTTGNNTT